MKLNLDINEQEHVGLTADVLSSLGEEILDGIKPNLKEASLSLAIVSEKDIQAMNKERRGKDETTDVLSFSFIEGEKLQGDGLLLGEIIICKSVAMKQAKGYGHDIHKEVEVLFVHGLLHILGYDHENPDDLKEMLELEQRFLKDKAGLVSRSENA